MEEMQTRDLQWRVTVEAPGHSRTIIQCTSKVDAEEMAVLLSSNLRRKVGPSVRTTLTRWSYRCQKYIVYGGC
jgi:hypothetical protein